MLPALETEKTTFPHSWIPFHTLLIETDSLSPNTGIQIRKQKKKLKGIYKMWAQMNVIWSILPRTLLFLISIFCSEAWAGCSAWASMTCWQPAKCFLFPNYLCQATKPTVSHIAATVPGILPKMQRWCVLINRHTHTHIWIVSLKITTPPLMVCTLECHWCFSFLTIDHRPALLF